MDPDDEMETQAVRAAFMAALETLRQHNPRGLSEGVLSLAGFIIAAAMEVTGMTRDEATAEVSLRSEDYAPRQS